MPCREVVVDCDWFVLDNHRIIKQFAYCDTRTEDSHQYTLTLPRCFAEHAKSFDKQTANSHGISWSKRGEYQFYQVGHIFIDIAARLDEKVENLCFWAKGLEKCKILSKYGFTVQNLETLDCPRFQDLNHRTQTTVRKAETFGMWLKQKQT